MDYLPKRLAEWIETTMTQSEKNCDYCNRRYPYGSISNGRNRVCRFHTCVELLNERRKRSGHR